MEKMGVEYQRFGGKEYVSLKRYYNLLCKCKALEKENKKLKERVEELERLVKELIEYKQDKEVIIMKNGKPLGYDIHDYKSDF